MFLRKFGNEHAVGGMEAKTNLVAKLTAHGVSIQLVLSAVIRRVFKRSLLPKIATAIAGNTNSTIKEIGKAADQAWDEVSGKPVTITQTVAAISRDSGRGKGGRQRGGPCRSGSCPPGNQSQQRLCYFHERWGDDAKRCISTCSRWASRGNVQPTKVFHVEQEDEMSANSEN